MTSTAKLTTVAVVNNAISAELTKQDLAFRDIPLKSVAIILLRDVLEPWMNRCAVVVRYPGRPADGILGQRRFLGFYRTAARLLRQIDDDANLRHLYIVNNDNLITGHLLTTAERNPAIDVSVVAEGIMNFQEIGTSSRSAWRWRVKPVFARLMRLRHRSPQGHLSGAFEARTSRVISFAAEGLKAPAEKIVLRRFQTIQPARSSDPTVALVVLTGLNQWMEPARFELFARSFVAWVEGSGFRKIQVKKHPRVSAGLIEELLESYEEIGAGLTTEKMAPDLEAGTVIGTCCTALVTFKLMRPDVQCIDFGSDYYSQHAYHGDESIKTLLSATGVSLVQMTHSQSRSSTQTDPTLRF